MHPLKLVSLFRIAKLRCELPFGYVVSCTYHQQDEYALAMVDCTEICSADVVALYYATSNPDLSRPIKYMWAVESSANYTTTGSGALK